MDFITVHRAQCLILSQQDKIIATWDRYLTPTTGLEILAQKGKRFAPRFYCDDTTAIVYITKAPVAILKLNPNTQFINTNVAWDVSESVSATGTIDTFDLTFGGGGASDLTGQDWSVDPLTGNAQYTSTGTFTVTLYVTDTGGNRSQAAKQRVDIVDIQGISKVYITTSDTGIFTYLPGGTPATANTGLSGGDLNSNDGILNPNFSHLAVGKHHYWQSNDNGIAFSVDGCATYTKITKATLGDPTNTAGDGSPPDTDDLDEIAIAFCPQDIRRVYLIRVTDATWNASFDPRAFLYWTDDYGLTWLNFGIGV